MNANFTTYASLNINLAPRLKHGDRFAFDLVDAVDRADFQTGFTAGAIVGIDDGYFFWKLFSRTRFGHDILPCTEQPVAFARLKLISPD